MQTNKCEIYSLWLSLAIKGRGLYVHVKYYDQHISKRIRGAGVQDEQTRKA